MKIEIDNNSGFCFGVVNAIKIAEKSLLNENKLFCLGDIVHNGEEINRLEKLGLKTISRDEYFSLSNCSVLIRAHGEPPETYEYARKNNINLVDATCPVVLRLQRRISGAYKENIAQNGQIVIFGKEGHAEVVGLNGQTNNNAIILQDEPDLDKIDFTKPIAMFSQTTRPVDDFNKLANKIKNKASNIESVQINDTICRQVANRGPKLREFASRHRLVLFISGKKSSNGKSLYKICKQENPNTYFVSRVSELDSAWFKNTTSVGICGATSTPQWLMEDIARWVEKTITS